MADAADFTIKAHDTLPSIQAVLMSAGQAVDLTTATAVKFILRLTTGGTAVVNAAAVVVTATGGVVRYDWATGDTATTGSFYAEFQVTWPGGKQQTFPTADYLTVSIVADLDNA